MVIEVRINVQIVSLLNYLLLQSLASEDVLGADDASDERTSVNVNISRTRKGAIGLRSSRPLVLKYHLVVTRQ